MTDEARMTDYQVLVEARTGPLTTEDAADSTYTVWRDTLPLISATGANAAIRKWVALQGESFAGATVRAVPCRSLNTTVVKVETQKKLTLA